MPFLIFDKELYIVSCKRQVNFWFNSVAYSIAPGYVVQEVQRMHFVKKNFAGPSYSLLLSTPCTNVFSLFSTGKITFATLFGIEMIKKCFSLEPTDSKLAQYLSKIIRDPNSKRYILHHSLVNS